jgi:hypothetical protein
MNMHEDGAAPMCKTCDTLMADYKYRAGLLENAVRNFTGVIGDDATRGRRSGTIEAGVS